MTAIFFRAVLRPSPLLRRAPLLGERRRSRSRRPRCGPQRLDAPLLPQRRPRPLCSRLAVRTSSLDHRYRQREMPLTLGGGCGRRRPWSSTRLRQPLRYVPPPKIVVRGSVPTRLSEAATRRLLPRFALRCSSLSGRCSAPGPGAYFRGCADRSGTLALLDSRRVVPPGPAATSPFIRPREHDHFAKSSRRRP